jgi:hypothetical protein
VRATVAGLRADNSRAEEESAAMLAKYREEMMSSQSQFDDMERQYYQELEQCRVCVCVCRIVIALACGFACRLVRACLWASLIS